MNVPNTLTLLRIILSIAVFVLIATKTYDWCLYLFLAAILTDFADGWWARKYGQISVFGRIMDPFADKFLICGVFTCFVAVPELTSDKAGYPAWLMLQPWMVIVLLGRELLVTSLRSFVEYEGGDFSAKWIGKWKMGFQCFAAAACMLYMVGGAEWNVIVSNTGAELLVRDFYRPDVAAQQQSFLSEGLDQMLGTKIWRYYTFFAMLTSLWLTVGITLISGLDYCIHAARMIRKRREIISFDNRELH
ncbi:MAG: CDP-diacylglycerol--glycerol-3-phosphate 3-phosphatidyltransferase [Planctomycetaceae bacterium]|jgi:CDP-diacylglycerol--glycerol-3-phosphate 3-phosphatidyltransferase|nr:CDP-diacylglycerol--glycerol-3-phosphate 3-phosphatidyltransferase [Planctomycetaceae bacterium]